MAEFSRLRWWLASLAGAILVALTPNAQASIDIIGNAGYSINGTTVTLTVDRITNNSSNVTTGTLHLQLWATSGSNPIGSGYTLADANLSYINGSGQLTPGASFAGISTTQPFQTPPCGTYFLHVLVTEFPDLNTIQDSVTMPTTQTLGCGGGGGGGSGRISLSGNAGYSVSGATATLNVDRITNSSPNVTSGTLHVRLWATTGSSPIGFGYVLADANLSYINGTGQLTPGASFSGISKSVPYSPPPCGTYTLHITVTEFPNLDTILDSSTMPNTHSLGCGGGGGGGGSSSNIVLQGSSGYVLSGGTVTLNVDRISNTSSTITTGTLHLKFWATSGTNPVGSGYELADANLSYVNGTGQLTPNSSFINISKSTPYSAPPCGTYYVHILVTEYPALDTIKASSTMPNTVTLGCAIVTGGGDAGGGGATGSLSIGGLACALLARRLRRREATTKRI